MATTTFRRPLGHRSIVRMDLFTAVQIQGRHEASEAAKAKAKADGLAAEAAHEETVRAKKEAYCATLSKDEAASERLKMEQDDLRRRRQRTAQK